MGNRLRAACCTLHVAGATAPSNMSRLTATMLLAGKPRPIGSLGFSDFPASCLGSGQVGKSEERACLFAAQCSCGNEAHRWLQVAGTSRCKFRCSCRCSSIARQLKALKISSISGCRSEKRKNGKAAGTCALPFCIPREQRRQKGKVWAARIEKNGNGRGMEMAMAMVVEM